MNYMRMVRDIERLFPTERIERSKARLRAVWGLKRPPDRIPFIYGSLPPADGAPQFDIWDGVYTDEESLASQLQAIIDRAQLEDDYIPSLYPGCRQGTIPTAFGAAEVRTGGHTWVKPIIRDVPDVFELGHPDFRRQGVAAEILTRVHFFRRATERRLPIQLPDMQGPLDLVANMWGTEPLLLAMYTDPGAVHYLLQRMTDAFIEYVRLLQEAAEGDLVPFHCHPVVWMPAECGMALSEDLLAVISPRLYPAFARPYNEQIADAFGGVVIHSCGSVEHNLQVLAETRGLLGVNFNNGETALPAVVTALKKKAVIVVDQSGITCHNLPLYTPEEHIRLSMQILKERDMPGIVIVEPMDLSRAGALALMPLATRLAALD